MRRGSLVALGLALFTQVSCGSDSVSQVFDQQCVAASVLSSATTEVGVLPDDAAASPCPSVTQLRQSYRLSLFLFGLSGDDWYAGPSVSDADVGLECCYQTVLRGK